MRLPNSAHTSRPWRIHELTRDFRLEDVWALPGTGGADDFPQLVRRFATGDPSQSSSGAARTLFAIPWKVGELLGWDGPDAGLGSRVPTLRDRLPAGLRDAPSGPDFDALPFSSLYLLGDEWAAEIANRTMHGVLHIGLVERPRTATPPPVGPLGGVGAPPLKLGPDSISLLSKAEEEAGQPPTARVARRPRRPRKPRRPPRLRSPYGSLADQPVSHGSNACASVVLPDWSFVVSRTAKCSEARLAD
jgi:hypothetical protein